MVDYENLQQQMLFRLRLVFEKHDILPTKFFNKSNGERSYACMQDFIKTIESVSQDSESLMQVYAMNQKWLEDTEAMVKTVAMQGTETEPVVDGNLINIAYTFNEFVDIMHGVFYQFQDGKLAPTHIEDFVLPSRSFGAEWLRLSSDEKKRLLALDSEYLDKKVSEKRYAKGDAEFLILQNGKICFAPNGHFSLAQYLNANGVDLRDGIRVEARKGVTTYFDFTTLHNYNFFEDDLGEDEEFVRIAGQKISFSLSNFTPITSDKDTVKPVIKKQKPSGMVVMTKEQAEVLGSIYTTVANTWSNVEPINNAINRSTGFGFGKKDSELFGDNPGLRAKNLNMLNRYVDGIDMRELQVNNDVHHPLN